MRIQVTYSDVLDHWMWEVTVDERSVCGFERTYENAAAAAMDQLRAMRKECA